MKFRPEMFRGCAAIDFALLAFGELAIFRIPGVSEDDGFKILKKYGVEY